MSTLRIIINKLFLKSSTLFSLKNIYKIIKKLINFLLSHKKILKKFPKSISIIINLSPTKNKLIIQRY